MLVIISVGSVSAADQDMGSFDSSKISYDCQDSDVNNHLASDIDDSDDDSYFEDDYEDDDSDYGDDDWDDGSDFDDDDWDDDSDYGDDDWDDDSDFDWGEESDYEWDSSLDSDSATDKILYGNVAIGGFIPKTMDYATSANNPTYALYGFAAKSDDALRDSPGGADDIDNVAGDGATTEDAAVGGSADTKDANDADANDADDDTNDEDEENTETTEVQDDSSETSSSEDDLASPTALGSSYDSSDDSSNSEDQNDGSTGIDLTNNATGNPLLILILSLFSLILPIGKK